MFDPDEKDRAKAFMERGFVPPGTRRYKDKRFMFDRVFDGGATQADVYGATARPLLDGLLEGYNATVFAYGVSSAMPLLLGPPSKQYTAGDWLRKDAHDQRDRR